MAINFWAFNCDTISPIRLSCSCLKITTSITVGHSTPFLPPLRKFLLFRRIGEQFVSDNSKSIRTSKGGSGSTSNFLHGEGRYGCFLKWTNSFLFSLLRSLFRCLYLITYFIITVLCRLVLTPYNLLVTVLGWQCLVPIQFTWVLPQYLQHVTLEETLCFETDFCSADHKPWRIDVYNGHELSLKFPSIL